MRKDHHETKLNDEKQWEKEPGLTFSKKKKKKKNLDSHFPKKKKERTWTHNHGLGRCRTLL